MSTAVEQLFISPSEEIYRIQSDLSRTFGGTLANFINEQAFGMAKNYRHYIQEIVLEPFKTAEKEVSNAPQNRNQEEQNELLQKIFNLMEPAKLAFSIETAVTAEKVNEQYILFINFLKNITPFKHIIKEATFNSKMINNIQQTALVNIKQSIIALKNYIKTLKEHQQVVRGAASGKVFKRIVKTGATLAGVGLGIPFLGLGVGALLGSGERERIQASLENVLVSIEFMQEEITNTIVDLLDSLHLMFLTLLSGTMLVANEIFKKHHSYIKDIDLNSELLLIGLEEKEQQRYEKWINVTTDKIEELAEQKKWVDAITLSQKFYEMTINNPIHARVILNDGRTGLYNAHTYYYAVYQEALLQEYINGHYEIFAEKGERLIRSLIAMPAQLYFPSFASSPSRFIVLLLSQYYGNASNTQKKSLAAELKANINERTKNKDRLYEENNLSLSDTAIFEIVDLFDIYIKNREMPKNKVECIPIEMVDEMILLNEELKTNISISEFLSKLKKEKSIVRSIIKRSIKPILFTILVGCFAYFISQTVIPYIQEKIAISEKVEKTEKTIKKVVIIEPIANIRNHPDYNDSKIIGSAEKGQKYKLLKGPIKDKGGQNVKWYKIKFNGKSAYLSSKLVKVKKGSR